MWVYEYEMLKKNMHAHSAFPEVKSVEKYHWNDISPVYHYI